MRIALLFIAFIILVTAGFARDVLAILPTSISGKVIKVADGDTIQVRSNDKNYKIRLSAIDCPEKKQPYGNAAKKFVLSSVKGKTVTVHPETTDRYGRIVGEVFLPDGTSLNRELVRNGLAWWYRKYSADQTIGELEDQARKQRLGLWQETSPVAPWDWRRISKKTTAASVTASAMECGSKQYCKQMASCEEAMFYLKKCGVTGLDRDRDGVPCESLCR